MRALSITLMSLALVTSSACQWEASYQVGSSTPVTAGESTRAPEGPTITKAQMQTGSGTPTTQFAVDTPELVCAWAVEGVEAGTQIAGAWVAVDTGGVAPPNQKIDEANLTLDGPTPGTFSLAKSMKEWPRGSYQVEIFLDGTLVKTVPFRIS
jgi:hypothetical protein